MNVSASPIFDDEGRFAGSLAMIADMSEQRDAEGRLKQALSGTVAAMGALVEMRDPYTAGHERRTAELVVAIARDFGLDEHTVETLDLTARMHDIGQIAVPAEILTRPGRLSQNEFTLVKAHPQVAYDILSSIDFGRPIAEVILQHHERLDGSGYPNGISGDDCCSRRASSRSPTWSRRCPRTGPTGRRSESRRPWQRSWPAPGACTTPLRWRPAGGSTPRGSPSRARRRGRGHRPAVGRTGSGGHRCDRPIIQACSAPRDTFAAAGPAAAG